MSLEHWFSDSDSRKLECLEKNLAWCHFVHHKLKVTVTTIYVNRMAGRLDCIVVKGKCDSTA